MALPFALARDDSSYPNRLQASSMAPHRPHCYDVAETVFGTIRCERYAKRMCSARRATVFLTGLPLLQQPPFPSSRHPHQAPIVSLTPSSTPGHPYKNPRRVWDPGIELVKWLLLLSFHHHDHTTINLGDNIPMVFALVVATTDFRLLFHYLHPSFHHHDHTTINLGDDISVDSRRRLAIDILPPAQSTQAHGESPLTMGALSIYLFRSLFHYCHPSLSRPTVPNI